MRFAGSDKATHIAVDVAGLTTVFLKGQAAKGEGLAHIVTQHGALSVVLISLVDFGVADQLLEELGRAKTVDAGHVFTAQVVVYMAQHLEAVLSDIGALDIQSEVHYLRRDLELGIEVVDLRAIGIQDRTLQGAHAQMFQGQRMLVAHALQMTGQHGGHGLHLGLRAKGTDPLDLLREHHIIMRNVRHNEGAELPLVPKSEGTRAADRQGRQQIERAIALLDQDLATAHRFEGKQVHLVEPPVTVGQQIDGQGECGHREAGIVEWVLHK